MDMNLVSVFETIVTTIEEPLYKKRCSMKTLFSKGKEGIQ